MLHQNFTKKKLKVKFESTQFYILANYYKRLIQLTNPFSGKVEIKNNSKNFTSYRFYIFVEFDKFLKEFSVFF